jgi:tRNA modification GTPase
VSASQDTIAAIATPIGEGSIGVIRLSGPQAFSLLSSIFRPARALDWTQIPSHTVYYGIFGREDDPLDQVVVTFFRGPRSYTGEDVVEISGHGNPTLLQCMLQVCLTAGARLAEPGEFTQRAFLNGKMDLTQAEAVADLVRAKTDHARRAAWGQLEGRLAQEVRRIRDHLLPLLAHVEVAIDHSDESHDFLSRDALVDQCIHVQNALDGLLASARVGKVLRDGFHVALIGRPNVGKSSVLNALLREDRAIVTPIAGTTRDTLQESVTWDGVLVVLTDTAGLHENASDPVEKLGIERTRQAVEKSDFVIVVQDGSQPLTAEDRAVQALVSERPRVVIANKADLASAISNDERVQVSAVTGLGLEALVDAVKMAALGGVSGAEARWMLNARHQAVLERAREALGRASEAAGSGAYEEVIALELKAALGALGEIIGETTTEELLGQIFANFCVGK